MTEPATVTDTTTNADADESRQPLFFSQPRPVEPIHLKGAGLKRAVGFDFARECNSIPLTAYEFVEVARSYPIVFSMENTPIPVAVVGLQKQNMFIGMDGKWAVNSYIPAYIRKYPFALFKAENAGQYILCVDEKSPHFKAKKPDLAFFDENDAPTEMCKQALELCGQYQKQYEMTQQIGKAFNDAGLLSANSIEAGLPDGRKINIGGFKTLDEEKWNGFVSEHGKEWHEKGWLGLGFLVLASQSNWKYLANLES